jgi:hypothetical protein
MLFTFVADSLIGFDSLLLATTGLQRDTTPGLVPRWRAQGTVQLAGSLDTLDASADLRVEGSSSSSTGLRSSPPASAGWAAAARGSPRPRAPTRSPSAASPSAATRSAPRYADSLQWSVGSTMGEGVRVDGTGQYHEREESRFLRIDTLLAALPINRYRLEQPVVVALDERAPR